VENPKKKKKKRKGKESIFYLYQYFGGLQCKKEKEGGERKREKSPLRYQPNRLKRK